MVDHDFLVGRGVWPFGLFYIFVGRKDKNDRKRASVGRVVGSKIKRSEAKMDKIRSVKLVVWFGSIGVTNTNTNYVSVVPTHGNGQRWRGARQIVATTLWHPSPWRHNPWWYSGHAYSSTTTSTQATGNETYNTSCELAEKLLWLMPQRRSRQQTRVGACCLYAVKIHDQ